MSPSLYLTLSIPLLLVLAGFHANAHGLTTFGKSNNNQQYQPPPPAATVKKCENQEACLLIKNTTCINNYCKCGDNQYPINGNCRAQFQGPNHICTKNDDCVDFADCISVRELHLTTRVFTNDMSICKCQEGYEEYLGTCGGSQKNYESVILVISLTLYLLL